MMKHLIRVGILVAVTFFAAFVTSVNAQSVTGSIANGTVTRGTPARATIYLSIPAGLHVNSNRPNGEYAIATTVKVSSNGATLGGVSYPRGRNRKFEFSEKPLNVYEGRVPFTFTVTAPATFRGRTVTVNATIHYQACTTEVCYAPKNKQITLTAKVN